MQFSPAKGHIVRDYDEFFFQMFEFYLPISEFTFCNIGHVVFQIQLVKRQDVILVTRSHLKQPLLSL